MTNRAKYIKLLLVVFIALMIIIGCVSREFHYVNNNQIKEFIISHNDQLTVFVEQIYESQNEDYHIYRYKQEIPSGVSKSFIYSNFKVDHIVVEKETGENIRKAVWVYIKNKPENDDYIRCGFYYSFDAVALDCFGNVIEGDSFEYENLEQRSRYKTEKIVDNWYYFEDAFWN